MPRYDLPFLNTVAFGPLLRPAFLSFAGVDSAAGNSICAASSRTVRSVNVFFMATKIARALLVG